VGLAEIIGGVVVILIGTGLLAGIKWLADSRNREVLGGWLRQQVCRHEWEPINKPGETLVVVSGDDEWCVKCGARRRTDT